MMRFKPATLWPPLPPEDRGENAYTKPSRNAPGTAPQNTPRYRGAGGAFLLLALLILLAAPAHAAASRRRAVLVLLHGTTAKTFLRAISDPKWERLRSESALGLMNANVPEPMTPESAYLTLGVGKRVAAPPGPVSAQSRDGASSPILEEGYRDLVKSRFTTLADCVVTGRQFVPAFLSPATPAGIYTSCGYLTAMTSDGSIEFAVPMPADPRQLDRWPGEVAETFRTTGEPLVILDLPAGTTPAVSLQLTEQITSLLDPIRDLLIITSADPGPPSHGAWTSLAPVLFWNWGWHERAVTSNTTRTRGLIANIDIAPTLLDHLGVPIPATMLGHPARPAGAGSVESALRYARGLRATHEAMKPGLIAWGAFAFLGFLAGVTALLTRNAGMLRRSGRFWLTWAAAFIPAMLLAGITFCGSAAELVGRVAVISLVVAVAAWSARRRISPVLLIYGLIVLTVLADLFTGSHLLQRSLLGDYAFTGARFYGIGNEFEGLILGTSILAPLWGVQVFGCSGVQGKPPRPLEESRQLAAAVGRKPPRPPEDRGVHPGTAPDSNTPSLDDTPSPLLPGEGSPEAPVSDYRRFPHYRGAGGATSPILPYTHTPTLLLIAALWLVTLYAVAAPTRGADFGGAFSLAVGYAAAAVGVWQLRTGKRLRFRQLLLAGAIVALVVAAMIGADLLRPAGSRSHVGDLAARALSEGWGPVWEIAVRKVRMNLGMILSPYCLVSLAGVLPVVAIGYHKLDPASHSILTRRPLLRVGVIATLIGAVAGLLANDSGIVAWAFATGCALLLCLDLMLDDGARKAPEASGTAPLPGSETA